MAQDPITLQLVPLLSLRPTQLCVGMQQVMEKAAHISTAKQGELMVKPKKLAKWLSKRPIPAVLGPSIQPTPLPIGDASSDDTQSAADYYIIDHHHLACALHSLGVQAAYVQVVADLRPEACSAQGNEGTIHVAVRAGTADADSYPNSPSPEASLGLDEDAEEQQPMISDSTAGCGPAVAAAAPAPTLAPALRCHQHASQEQEGEQGQGLQQGLELHQTDHHQPQQPHEQQRLEFWSRMDALGYVWPFGCDGQQLGLEQFVKELPRDVRGLRDDPHRSLAALLRKAGGYDKVWVPFSEFRWANYLRTLVPIPPGSDPAADAIMAAAMAAASHPSAAEADLPGVRT